LQLLSVEIAGVALPAEYVDQETGRCCVLLGHLGDPDVPRGFNVTVPHQHQWILQSVLFVPARVLTRAQCLAIRKDGAEARKKIAEEFVKNKSYSVCDIPAELWPKGGSASTPAPTGTAIAAEKQQETKSVSISTTTSAPKAVSPTSPPPVDTKVPIPVQPETKPVAEKSSSSSLETKMPPPTSTTEDAKKVKASPNPCTDITSVTPTATTTQPRSPFVRSS
jgi:hypothetical protein